MLSRDKIYYYVELPLGLCLWDAKIIVVHKSMLETDSKSVAALLLSSMTSNFWEFIKNLYCTLSSGTLLIESMCVRESQHLNIFPLHIKSVRDAQYNIFGYEFCINIHTFDVILLSINAATRHGLIYCINLYIMLIIASQKHRPCSSAT